MTTEIVQNAGAILGDVHLGLGLNEVIVIGVARAERQLQDTVKQATDASNEKTSRADKIKREVNQQNEAELLSQYQDKLDAVTWAIRMLGGSVSHTVSTGRVQHTSDVQQSTLEISVCGKSDGFAARYSFSLCFSAELQAKVAEATFIHADAAHDRQVAVDARKKLSNIGSLERQLRARVAEKKLSTIAGGKELLALLTNDIDAQILALPGI